MARHISADSTGYVYRALVTVEFEDGRVSEHTYGPYTKRSSAKAQMTREIRYYSTWRTAAGVVGKVQSAYLKDWIDVDA